MNQQSLAALIWSVADRQRGDYKQSDYSKLLESTLLMQQATNNSEEHFSNSPDLASELMNAIIDGFEAQGTMTTQPQDSEKGRQGLKHILLGPAKLYEALGSAAQ